MSENKTPNDTYAAEEAMPAISFANDYLATFDSLSTRLKRGYSRTSIWVIFITFATSVLAVLSPLLSNWGMSGDLLIAIQNIIKAFLIAMPFVAVALLDYSRQFITNTAWIHFREAAERIRSNIFLFKMKAGEYKGQDDYACQRRLVVKIKMIYEDYEQFEMIDIDNKNRKKTWFNHLMSIPDLLMDTAIKLFEHMAIADPKKSRNLPENAAPIEQYINERLDYQLTWYDHRIKGDYKKMLYSRVAIILITAFSGIIAAFVTDISITIVAVLSALATAINLLSDTLMYGATYTIYDDAMRELKLLKAEWRIKKQEGNITETDQTKLVEDVEKVLMDELQLWKEGIIRKVEASERAILKNLNEGGNLENAPTNLNTSTHSNGASAISHEKTKDTDETSS